MTLRSTPSWRLATRAVHAGQQDNPPTGAVIAILFATFAHKQGRQFRPGFAVGRTAAHARFI